MARNGHARPSPSRPGSQRNVPACRSGNWKDSLAAAASGPRESSGSAAAAPSTPRQCSATGAGNSFPTKISTFSPRFSGLSRPVSAQIGVSGPSGRRARRPGAAVRAREGRCCARPPAGSAGLSAAAPNPVIRVRRSSGNFALAIAPIRTIFVLRSPAVRPAAQRPETGHFFAANGCAHAISRRPRHRGRT